MKSSVAPTPVMPKTATAVAKPVSGSRKRSPSATRAHEKCSPCRVRTIAANTVRRVKSATFTRASLSTRS